MDSILDPTFLLIFSLGLLCIVYVFERTGVFRTRSIRELLPFDQANGAKNNGAAAYATMLPPSRREAVSGVLSSSVANEKTDEQRLANPIPLAKPASELNGSEVSPTGFTVDEIRHLIKRLDDYPTFSGVPLPTAYTNFDIKTALPRPYRPFRWRYVQTMALHQLDTDWWLELESSYAERMQERKQFYADNGDLISQVHHSGMVDLASLELMHTVVQFLCTRYPHYFSLDRDKMILHNKILQTQTNLETTPPMQVVFDHVPEDFAVMIRNPEDGQYYFRAGIICSAIGWSLGQKILKPMRQIHAPVPHYKQKMAFSVDRFFANMPTDKPIMRGSWGIEIDQPLFQPPGDPKGELREAQDPQLDVDRCHLRVDWQTLRRLPLTGAIVFNFKAVFTPIVDFRREPFIPALVLKVLNEGDADIQKYKGTWHVEHVAKPALASWAREQEQAGLVPKNWDPLTLDQEPFYPGWKEKWEAAQGFSCD